MLEYLLDLIFSNFTSDSTLSLARNGASLPESLGLTQVRYNIGGGEAPQYHHFMRTGGAVEGYWAADRKWNWSADATQRLVLAGALYRGVDLVHAFSNSPPAWMTVSGSTTGARGGVSNLQPWHYDDFATYMATVVKRFATDPALLGGRTLVFDAVTPINEPNSMWWKFGNDQEGCHFSPVEQSTILSKLAKKLRAMNVTGTPISGAEENAVDQTIGSVEAYSKEVLDEMPLVTTHTYNAGKGARQTLARWARDHGKVLWNSEFGTGEGPLQGGIKLAQAIEADLRELNCTVWTLWQAVDLDNTLSPSGWGSIVATNPPTGAKFKIRKQYYSFKQFTAFIRPGSTLLSVNSSSSNVSVVAAIPKPEPWATGGDLAVVLVAANAAESEVRAPVSFAGLPSSTSVKHVSAYLTDASHDCIPVAAPSSSGGSIELILPGESITTLVVDLAPGAGAEPPVLFA